MVSSVPCLMTKESPKSKQRFTGRERVPGPEWSTASPLTKASKVQSPKNRHWKMSRDDERGLGGLDPSGVSDLSLKSKN